MDKFRLYGWTVYLKVQNDRWYATKRINSKLYTVYIGTDQGLAEEKIEAYCEKKGLILDKTGATVVPDLTQREMQQREESKIIAELQEKVADLEITVESLMRRIIALENRPTTPKKRNPTNTKPKAKKNHQVVKNTGSNRVLGHILRLKPDGKWYANKGKINIYLGADVSKAEEKITAWYEKKGLSLPQEV